MCFDTANFLYRLADASHFLKSLTLAAIRSHFLLCLASICLWIDCSFLVKDNSILLHLARVAFKTPDFALTKARDILLSLYHTLQCKIVTFRKSIKMGSH